MAEKKRQPQIQASDVKVGNRTLEAVLLDLAERSKSTEERATKALEEIAVLKRETSAALEQSRLALEQNRLALDHLSALTRDHMGLSGRTGRIETRLDALEKAL